MPIDGIKIVEVSNCQNEKEVEKLKLLLNLLCVEENQQCFHIYTEHQARGAKHEHVKFVGNAQKQH